MQTQAQDTQRIDIGQLLQSKDIPFLIFFGLLLVCGSLDIDAFLTLTISFGTAGICYWLLDRKKTEG